MGSLFFFNDTATTEIYTLSLHDALPISVGDRMAERFGLNVLVALHSITPEDLRLGQAPIREWQRLGQPLDRKSTRLNSSHANISYAVFCLKKNTHNSILLVVQDRPSTPP